MKLTYEAYDRTGRRVRDTIEASTSHEASETLRKQGLFVTTIGAGAPGARAAARTGGSKRGVGTGKRLKHLTIFARQLHVLVETGTPLVEALYAIERQAKDKAWRDVVEQVRTRVEEGSALHEALSEHPQWFDAITRSLVAAGESAGKLPHMLDRIGKLARKQAHVRSSILGAMVYPALLIVVALAVLLTLLMFVLPRFSELFETLDMPLPPTTEFLMTLSMLLRSYWWALPAIPIGAYVGIKALLATPTGIYAMHTAAVRLPPFGKIVQSFATARIMRLMGILLDSHLPLLEVLALVKESTTNTHYHTLLERAEDAVTRGEPISTAFNDPSLISPSVYESIRSGESSGRVGALMLNVADFLDEDNDVIVKSLTSIIEPIILIVLGVLVGFVAMSMFMPLFDLTAMTSSGG